MQRSYSPKKNCLSSSHLNCSRKDASSRKNSINQTSVLPKKLCGEGHMQFAKKYAIIKGSKGSMKLSHKYDPSKKYLFHNTTCVTPFDKSAMPSYVSTPLEKSINIGGNTISVFQDNLTSFKSITNPSRKQIEFMLSTEEENYSDNSVKVTFLMLTGNDKRSVSKMKKLENAPSEVQVVHRKVLMSFSNFVTFSSMKISFLQSKKCLSEEILKNYYGFLGFETVPYNYQLSNLINCSTSSFETLIAKNIREINLVPIFIYKELSYESLQFKDFQILRHLGSGGFSTVYLGKCLLDGQLCALKFIQKQSVSTPKKIRMLENERNILLKIRHPNLVQMHYAFETKNYIIFGLEYCPNGNLYNFLQKRKSFTEEQIKFILRQLLNGLEYLHQNNILFRDIKLENILFDGEGKIKITDFGLSKPEIGDEEITYSYCGSPEYMAPQMLSKTGHSFEVDYYALGILLYELFYGRSPFYAPKKEDIFQGIINNEVTFPKNPVISKEAKALMKGLLTKNPKHRIGSLKGIQEIGSHPWMRNYSLDSSQQPVFSFNSSYDLQAPADHRRIKETFDQQKLSYTQPKYFFQHSFVNKDLKERVMKEITPLRGENPQNFIKKRIVKEKENIDLFSKNKISHVNPYKRKERKSHAKSQPKQKIRGRKYL